MNNTLKFKQKLDLLIITIEAIDLYYFTNTNQVIQKQNILKNIFLIRNGNSIRNSQNYSLCNFTETIHIIHQIYLYSKQIYIQEIIIDILNYSSYSLYNSMELQYFNRFNYIYRKTQNYYNHFSYYNKKNKIEDIAIFNLYIINKIHNKYGFYFLIKYLLYI